MRLFETDPPLTHLCDSQAMKTLAGFKIAIKAPEFHPSWLPLIGTTCSFHLSGGTRRMESESFHRPGPGSRYPMVPYGVKRSSAYRAPASARGVGCFWRIFRVFWRAPKVEGLLGFNRFPKWKGTSNSVRFVLHHMDDSCQEDWDSESPMVSMSASTGCFLFDGTSF